MCGDSKFDAEVMPAVLYELREAWPCRTAATTQGSIAAPVISLQEALQAALSESLEVDVIAWSPGRTGRIQPKEPQQLHNML